MFIPNGFTPSSTVRRREYDEEGRMREVSYSAPTQDGGIAESTSMFATEAEQFGAVTPFLKRNKIRDAHRRNYVVQPGGACLYFEEERRLDEPWKHNMVMFDDDVPTEQESFGHEGQPGGPLQGPAGRKFSLGAVGDGGFPGRGGR